jgi:hypothetical protein
MSKSYRFLPGSTRAGLEGRGSISGGDTGSVSTGADTLQDGPANATGYPLQVHLCCMSRTPPSPCVDRCRGAPSEAADPESDVWAAGGPPARVRSPDLHQLVHQRLWITMDIPGCEPKDQPRPRTNCRSRGGAASDYGSYGLVGLCPRSASLYFRDETGMQYTMVVR